MIYRIAADATLILHFAFIAFVLFGALLAFRYRRVVWLHLPAALWGAYVEIAGRLCPLTTLENLFRRRAGQSGYAESFIEHYLVPLIYPSGLTRGTQYAAAVIVIVVNLAIYGLLIRRSRARDEPPDSA